MTTHLFTLDGTSIEALARETRDAAKAQSLKLKDARNAAAAKHGFPSWQVMVENAVEYGREEFDDGVVIIRKGRDKIVINLDAFYDDESYEDNLSRVLKPLHAVSYLRYENGGSVQYDIDFQCVKEGQAFHGCSSFCWNDFAVATQDADEGEYESVVGLLYNAGFFTGLDSIPLKDSEHEAVMVLLARAYGRSLGDRILFNAFFTSEEHVVLDFSKRCFANLLDNGDVMVCNGDAFVDGGFLWKILSRAEFDVLVNEMHSKLGPDAHFNGHGEIWMHDQVLSEVKNSATVEPQE
ncbi:MAG: hypothetical protein ABJN42_09935 [Roseibium sp.]|uniref:hypothetical protein n=1 Tax=Roseibium sp. TaxID=1936156 RepID=UPI003298616D